MGTTRKGRGSRARTKTEEARTGLHRGHRRIGRLAAAALVLPTIAVQAATTTSAGAAVVAGFEIDGNTPVDGGGKDWASTGSHATDPVGNADTSTFSGGSKEFDNPSTWVTGTGLAPNQDDISDVYVHDAIVDDDIWGFIGFRRLTTSGVTNFDIEFNQLENSSSYAPDRSVRDVMVRFEQDGNSAFQLTSAYFWREVDSSRWGPGCTEVSGYSPDAGWCEVDADAVPFTGTTGEDGHFGEGAFNFTTLLRMGGGDITCLGGNFGTMNIRTFTGNANESALKDYVDAVTVDVGNTCGALEIHKVDQFGDAVGGATFSISPNPLPGGGTDPYVVTDGGANDPDSSADGIVIIDPAAPGDYTITETDAPDGYLLDDTVHHVTVGKDGVGSVGLPAVFTDPLVFKAPAITNKVTATYDVDYAWQVTKSVDVNRADVPVGGSATFTYGVGVTALGPPARSGFEVRGTLGVSHTNERSMLVTLSASLAGAGACTIAATDESAAAGLQVTVGATPGSYAYTCAPGASPADPASTTATATWDAAVYPQDTAGAAYTVSAKAESAYAIDQKTDETTTVTDTFNGGAPVDLGTLDWDDVWAAPGHAVLVKSYTRTLSSTAGQCTSYPNIARESADATTDTETVVVCMAEVLPAQSFGKAVGSVKASCQGTVRAKLSNRSGETVTYKLGVGKKVHKIAVKSLARKKFVTHGEARARVTLKVGSTRLDKLRIPALCEAPEVLPDTGLRATSL
ncbi:prealbumin-like fold domain-containing protein [Nocardia sp. N13]|uniref:prealbumin-like fold domain-containing protein n=1 Tax=Nocardioides sp. N13(2025) TaxID=3453405 RepID=UPI003F767E09